MNVRKFALSLIFAAATVSAAPSTTDLWDSSQSGFSGPTALGGGGSFCGAFLNIFGGSGNNGCGQAFSTTFDAFGFSGLSLRWSTASVTVGSVALFSQSDFGGLTHEILGIRLYTLDANNQNPVLFYDSGTISHNPANDGSTPLLQVTLNSPVTSSNWRVDIIDQPSNGGDSPIYRIIELDAFAPADGTVPEPSTLAITVIGIAALVFRNSRRTR